MSQQMNWVRWNMPSRMMAHFLAVFFFLFVSLSPGQQHLHQKGPEKKTKRNGISLSYPCSHPGYLAASASVRNCECPLPATHTSEQATPPVFVAYPKVGTVCMDPFAASQDHRIGHIEIPPSWRDSWAARCAMRPNDCHRAEFSGRACCRGSACYEGRRNYTRGE